MPGPIPYITTYLPDTLAFHFGRHDLKRKPILRLFQEPGVELGRARQTVSARQTDAGEAAELEVPIGTALLAIRCLVFDHENRPIQMLHGSHRPDRYQYEMDVSKVSSLDVRISVRESLTRLKLHAR